MQESASPNTGPEPPTGTRIRKVAVFGGGIAGLSAAHELIRLGHAVQVFEANGEAGGFFRSARFPRDHKTPSEYFWHGMGPWYHNAFDLMRQIPFDDKGSIYDRVGGWLPTNLAGEQKQPDEARR